MINLSEPGMSELGMSEPGFWGLKDYEEMKNNFSKPFSHIAIQQ